MKTIKSIIISIFILFLFFQNSLQDKFSIFQYFDELIALSCVIFFLCHVLIAKRINKHDLATLIIVFGIILLGLVSGFMSKVTPSIFYQFVDVLSTFKFFFVILYLQQNNNFYSRNIDYKLIFKIILPILKLYLLILLFYAGNNFFRDIDMNYGERFGIRAFSFVYGTPGLLINQMTYILVIFSVFSLVKIGNFSIFKWEILASLLITISTLRFRGFIIVIVYLLLIFIGKNFLQKNKNIQINKKRIFSIVLIIGIVASFIGRSQFSMYFLEGNTPRQRFVVGAIQLAQRYFPLGSGFGTFGSSVAADQYSKIYLQLGFNQYYGMKVDDQLFLNDNYFPMILGQFGVVGFTMFLYILLRVFKKFIENYKANSHAYLLSVFISIDILFSSIQSSYLAHYSVVALLFIFMVLVKAIGKEKKLDY